MTADAPVRFRLRLCHRVTVVHGGTGLELPWIAAELVRPVWPHWRLRRRGAHVLLSAYEPWADDRPDRTTVRIRVTTPSVAVRLEQGGEAEIELRRDDDAVEHTLAPLDHAVEVALVDDDGDPVAGRTVRIRATKSSASIAAPEVSPGLHRTAHRQWSGAFRPSRVVVDGTPQDRRVTPDWREDITRVQLVISM